MKKTLDPRELSSNLVYDWLFRFMTRVKLKSGAGCAGLPHCAMCEFQPRLDDVRHRHDGPHAADRAEVIVGVALCGLGDELPQPDCDGDAAERTNPGSAFRRRVSLCRGT